MATANHFQTRVLIPGKANLSEDEIRLNSLINQAQSHSRTLTDLQQRQYRYHIERQSQLETWLASMLIQIDRIHDGCLTDLTQSFEQLKTFQRIILNILERDNENSIDQSKLSAIEHEISLLRCLTYQLDTTRVKIHGQLKLSKGTGVDEYDIFIADNQDNEQKTDEQRNRIIRKEDFLCRLLMHTDAVEKIRHLTIFKESVQMTNCQLDQTTPERVLTILGPHPLNVVEQFLSTLYPSSPCELRVLLHQFYAPCIVGKLGDRSKMLRDKYSLRTLTIHPTCAPHSTERILLLQGISIANMLECLDEIFLYINENPYEGETRLAYDESNYDASLAHEYGGFASSQLVPRPIEQHQYEHDENVDTNDPGVRRYSAFDAWNGSVDSDSDHVFPVVKLGNDCISRESLITHGEFGALLGPHGIRIAQIRAQCRTVRIHTVAGSSINTCSVQVVGPRADVNHAVRLIIQSIKEHDRKFPFKQHRFSGRLR